MAYSPVEPNVVENSFEDVISEFQKECVEEYFRVVTSKESDLSFDSKKHLENFNELVFAST